MTPLEQRIQTVINKHTETIWEAGCEGRDVEIIRMSDGFQQDLMETIKEYLHLLKIKKITQ